MAKKTEIGRTKKKRRQAAGFFVLENKQSGEMTFADDSQFDAGYVQRKQIRPYHPEIQEYREKFRAITPSKRITAVTPPATGVDAQEPGEHEPSWIKTMTKDPSRKKN